MFSPPSMSRQKTSCFAPQNKMPEPNGKNPPRTAIIYLRKSQLSNADNDLEAHERRCRKIAAQHGDLEPVVLRESEGHRSAFSDSRRPGYREMEERVTSGRVSRIYVNDRARIWRNAVEWLTFLTLCRKHGTEIVPAIEGAVGDVGDPNQQLLEFINGWKNEQYRTAVSRSLRATKADLRRAGLFVANRPPMGLTLVGSKFERKLVANDDLAILVEALELYVGGLGCDLVARQMNARGRKWHYGQRWVTFGGQALRHVIRRIELYQPFLDPLLYERVLDTRERRRGRKQNSARQKHPRLLLSKLLYCAHCGSRFYSNYHLRRRQKTVVYPSYLHPDHIACPTERRWFGAGPLDAQAWDQLQALQERIRENLAALVERAQMLVPGGDAADRRRTVKAKLEKELLNLRRSYNRGDFGDPGDAAVREFFRDEQTRLEKELAEMPAPEPAAPHTQLTLRQIELLAEMPLAVLRQNAAEDPDAANGWLGTVLERAELRAGKLELKVHAELERLLGEVEDK